MTTFPNDLTLAEAGSLTLVPDYHDQLRIAGDESRVVVDNLTAGPGTDLPSSLELWAHRGNAGTAEATIIRAGQSQGELESRHDLTFGHPETGPMADLSRCPPQHGAPSFHPLP